MSAIFTSFCTAHYDIKVITPTFTLQNGGTSRYWCKKTKTYTFPDTCHPTRCTFLELQSIDNQYCLDKTCL